MSRIGNKHIDLPAGVTVTEENGVAVVKGPKGTLNVKLNMSNPQQVVKAMLEAEAYHGPSLIIAYAPCINHGLRAKGGMGKAQAEIKKAVAAGYWQLYRFNPDNENPMTVDSKAPTASYQEFIKGENRYASLIRQFPAEAEKLFAEAETDAAKRLESYKKLAGE